MTLFFVIVALLSVGIGIAVYTNETKLAQLRRIMLSLAASYLIATLLLIAYGIYWLVKGGIC